MFARETRVSDRKCIFGGPLYSDTRHRLIFYSQCHILRPIDTCLLRTYFFAYPNEISAQKKSGTFIS